MNVSLDYDKTYTEDPECWKKVVRSLQSSGHKVFCVTLRSKEIDYHKDFDVLELMGVRNVFCDGRPKRKTTEDLGIKIDVWIDDAPEAVTNGGTYTPAELHEWRSLNAKSFPKD